MARRLAVMLMVCAEARGFMPQCPRGGVLPPMAHSAGAAARGGLPPSMRGVRAISGRPRTSPARCHFKHALPASAAMSAAKKEGAHSGAADSPPNFVPGAMPKFDKLDRTILLLSVPAIVNFMLVPLVGAADTFWVGKMNNAAALAGTGGANQIYSTTFWVLGFLPSVITPLVAQAYGAKDMDGVQRHIGEALFLSLVIGLLASIPKSPRPSVFYTAQANIPGQ
jgi:hypothetical protein